VHTHTGNTRQLEPQLKRCHSEPQLKECHVLNLYPEPQFKDTFRATTQGTPASRSSRYHRSLVHNAHPKQEKVSLASALSPGTTPEPLGETRFQTAWRGTRAIRRQAPQNTLTCKPRLAGRPPPPGTISSGDLLESPLSPSGSRNTANRDINICAILKLIQVQAPLLTHSFTYSLNKLIFHLPVH